MRLSIEEYIEAVNHHRQTITRLRLEIERLRRVIRYGDAVMEVPSVRVGLEVPS